MTGICFSFNPVFFMTEYIWLVLVMKLLCVCLGLWRYQKVYGHCAKMTCDGVMLSCPVNCIGSVLALTCINLEFAGIYTLTRQPDS